MTMGVRPAGGRPTREEAAARTGVLLDTARELFSQKGYAATTIDEIAAVLRWSKHTIYRRYEGKLALLEAVVERDVERFRLALVEAAAGGAGDPMACLRLMARSYFGFSASRGYSALYAAIALESATSANLRARLGQWASAALDPLLHAVGAATPVGGWTGGTAQDVRDVLIDLLDGAANRAKWIDADDGALDAWFAARWEVFRRATMPAEA